MCPGAGWRLRAYMVGRRAERHATRPGTPEYDAFTKKQQAEANRDKSKDPPKPQAGAPKLTQ